MDTQLQLHLFGFPQITWRGETVMGFVSNKARALLIYLAVTGRAHSRDALAELLWADTPSTKRANLKKALSNVRNRDGVTLLEEGQRLVALDRDRSWVDAVEFGQLVDNAAPHDVDTLHRAVQLYQDDFLSGFNISFSYEFEAWALGEQARLKEQMVEVLRRLAEGYAQRNELPQAIAAVRHLLQLEPWREEAHCQLIELLARSGDRSAALAHFETCRERLRAELDVEPGAATLELIAKIRADTLYPLKPLFAVSSSQPVVRPIVHKQLTTTVEFPLVGRDREWQAVHALWRESKHPHFICIGGEAGIGKTRLAEELLLVAEAGDAPVARTRSHALQGQLAYAPIADWLRTAPLQRALAQLDDVWLTEIARLLPELLVDRPTLPPPQPLRESWQRKRLFDALCHAVASVQGPLLLVLDDLQWTDAETLEWLQYLVELVEQRLLVVGTVRTDEIAADHPLHRLRQQLQRHDRFTELALAPLDQHATTALATHVTTQALPGKMAERLFHDTAGNPLFVIESLRATATVEDVVALPRQPDQVTIHEPLAMPPKMYSVIQARLAQLSPHAQSLAELGATIGRAFDVTLLARAAECDEEAVLLGLDELWQRRVIQEADATHFDFSHDRIRDVAYGEISPIRRRLLHRKVANALEMIHSENLDAISGHLAVHWEAAGLFAQAITFYQRAADGARRLFAHQEAIKYRQQAIRSLRQLPQNTEHRQAEIDLLLTLGQDRMNAHGLGSPFVHQDLQAAYELAQDVGTPIQQVNVLNALSAHARVRGEWIHAHHLAIKTLAEASEVGDPIQLAQAHFAIGCTLMRRGNLKDAHAQFEQIPLVVSEYPRYSSYLTRYAYCLWLLGFPDQALQQVARALELRRQYEPLGLPIPLHHYSSIALFCGDLATVDRLSAELVEVTTTRQDEFSLRWGQIYRGWLLVQQGNLHDGIILIRENADEHRARENYFYECVWRSLLAEAYILASDLDAAFTEIDSTLAYAEKSGDCHWNAQLLKLRGDGLQAGKAPDEKIEHCYQLAIDTARTQKARSLELRATTSLCRLWQNQGRIAEAYQLLTGIYGWFTEGFDTGDLLEAKALLAELRLGSAI